MNRKKFITFITNFTILITSGGFFRTTLMGATENTSAKSPGPKKRFAMGIRISECIGCGSCVVACKTENNVPKEPFYFRTWVERYLIKKDDSVVIHSINGGSENISDGIKEKDILRSFFVPKLCNHCDNPPCAQVCPVGATFKTEDGIVLVDEYRCIGCSYCLQACPYGARYIHPSTRTADKCTLCYHRINKGLAPVCVEVCPTQARVFGDLESGASPLVRLRRMKNTQVLKPSLNTEPKVFYTDLDGVVK